MFDGAPSKYRESGKGHDLVGGRGLCQDSRTLAMSGSRWHSRSRAVGVAKQSATWDSMAYLKPLADDNIMWDCDNVTSMNRWYIYLVLTRHHIKSDLPAAQNIQAGIDSVFNVGESFVWFLWPHLNYVIPKRFDFFVDSFSRHQKTLREAKFEPRPDYSIFQGPIKK